MCGIYGITDNDPEFIKKYIEICKHRGPDGSDIWTSDHVTLGHNLLSIMAEPNQSRQPWKTPKGNILVYNGEIFNYNELVRKFKNFKNLTGCDTELLAWGLDEYGIKFIDEIDSMHGFAYYDISNKTITLSRDHAGIKPLFYAKIDRGIIFASEIKGMLDIVPNARKLDNIACSMLSRVGTNPLRNTLFSNIKKVLPGETLVYTIDDQTLESV